ncbi:MAG: hypothetical protein AB7H97_15705, partial [Pseudobdellovibrionaceae bacterium]
SGFLFFGLFFGQSAKAQTDHPYFHDLQVHTLFEKPSFLTHQFCDGHSNRHSHVSWGFVALELFQVIELEPIHLNISGVIQTPSARDYYIYSGLSPPQTLA